MMSLFQLSPIQKSIFFHPQDLFHSQMYPFFPYRLSETHVFYIAHKKTQTFGLLEIIRIRTEIKQIWREGLYYLVRYNNENENVVVVVMYTLIRKKKKHCWNNRYRLSFFRGPFYNCCQSVVCIMHGIRPKVRHAALFSLSHI